MASLLVKSEGFNTQVIHLKLGLNRFGRAPTNDFQLEHPTISARHCEIILGADSVEVRDCDSTNGTFVDGEPIARSALRAGQTLHLGDVELFVEETEINITIPEIEVARLSAAPLVLSDGTAACSRHPQALATHQCTHCKEILCDACVHRLRRRGGKLLKLCPICSHMCERIGGEKKKKKSFFAFLHKTVKLPFIREQRRS